MPASALLTVGTTRRASTVEGIAAAAPFAVDLAATARGWGFLVGDPTCEITPSSIARATWTPDGPGTIRATRLDDSVVVETFGDGAGWLSARTEPLLGGRDDVRTFDPTHPVVARLWARHPGLRIARSETCWHDLAWAVVQQRVDIAAAAQQWRALVRSFGTPAPGPGSLLVPPDPAWLARTGYAPLHQIGIERRRAETLVAVAREAARLDRALVTGDDEFIARVARIPGVGPWTVGMVRATTLGDADVVIGGDTNLPRMVVHALDGRNNADDAAMNAALAPFAPHRWRVVRLLWIGGAKTPGRRRSVRTDMGRRAR